jgi:hypothetical protein
MTVGYSCPIRPGFDTFFLMEVLIQAGLCGLGPALPEKRFLITEGDSLQLWFRPGRRNQ